MTDVSHWDHIAEEGERENEREERRLRRRALRGEMSPEEREQLRHNAAELRRQAREEGGPELPGFDDYYHDQADRQLVIYGLAKRHRKNPFATVTRVPRPLSHRHARYLAIKINGPPPPGSTPKDSSGRVLLCCGARLSCVPEVAA